MFKYYVSGLLLMLISSISVANYEQYNAKYQVTITNITPGQTFTPQLVITHPKSTRLFKLGKPASKALELLAEAGDTAALTETLKNKAYETKTIPGLLGPGKTVKMTINSTQRKGFISIAAMLIPTNDTFVALNRVRLPRHGSITRFVPAYDAGTEKNDQSCQNIPGPRCGGEGHSPVASDGDEGFVHIGNGFHELGGIDAQGFEVLGPQVYDWRNSVAKITVKRIR